MTFNGEKNKFLEKKPKEKDLIRYEKDRFKIYLKRLLLKEDDLKNKKILDVGGGGFVGFGSYVRKKIKDVKIFTLDKYIWPEQNYNDLNLEKKFKFKGFHILGESQSLPFEDNYFDLLISHAYLGNEHPEMIKKALEEMFRVVKIGGEIRISPIEDSPFEFGHNIFEEIKKFVEYLELNKLANVQMVKIGYNDDSNLKEKSNIDYDKNIYTLIIKKIK